jgi:hypothetical protein
MKNLKSTNLFNTTNKERDETQAQRFEEVRTSILAMERKE